MNDMPAMAAAAWTMAPAGGAATARPAPAV
jgi:hypothetical protein